MIQTCGQRQVKLQGRNVIAIGQHVWQQSLVVRHLQIVNSQHVLSNCSSSRRSTSHTMLQGHEVEHVDNAIMVHVACRCIIRVGTLIINNVFGCLRHVSLVDGTAQIDVALLEVQAQAEPGIASLGIERLAIRQTDIILNPVAKLVFADIYSENMVAVTMAVDFIRRVVFMEPCIIKGSRFDLAEQVCVGGDARREVYQQVILLHVQPYEGLQSFRYWSEVGDVVAAGIDVLQRCQSCH